MLDAGALFVALAAFVYAYVQARRRATTELVQGLEQRLNRNTERLAAIESDLRHVPDAKAFHDMALALEEVKGGVREMAAELKGFREVTGGWARRLDLIDNWLREKS